jgi:predicted RNA-binding protein with PIN domain
VSQLVGPQVILIDGYNVIRTTPGLAAAERVSLTAGREALLESVAATYRHTPHRVVIVFDGDGPAETVAPLGRTRGQVVFTRRGESADDLISRLAGKERQRGAVVVVVSDDLGVRLESSAEGAATARPDALNARLNQPPRDVRQRGRHRAAVRAEMEARDERGPQKPGGTAKKGNHRRAPRRRGSRGDVL